MRDKYQRLQADLKAWNKTDMARWELIAIIEWLAERVIEEKNKLQEAQDEIIKGRKELSLAKAREAKQKKRADALQAELGDLANDLDDARAEGE